MKIHSALFFWLFFSSLCLNAQTPIDKYYVFLEAEPKAGPVSSNYEVYLEGNLELLPGAVGRKVYAIHDPKRPLNDPQVGSADVVRIEKKKALLKVSLKPGFTPGPYEVLLVDLPVKPLNPYYQSITLDVAAYDITLKSLEGRLLLDLFSMKNDGVLAEYDQLQQLRLDVRRTARKMRKQMAPQTIQSGRFAGQDLFDAMAAITDEELRNFLNYLKSNPVKYMGQNWKISEIYATWLLQGAVLSGQKSDIAAGAPGTGFRLQVDKNFGYPRIVSASRAIYGKLAEPLLNGLVISINGQSLYGKDVSVAENLLKGELYQEFDMTFLGQDGVVSEASYLLLPASATPGWIEAGEISEWQTLLPVRRGDKWGFIDASGYEVIPLKFDDIKDRQSPFRSGLEAVKQGELWGFINLEGNWVLRPAWKTVANFRDGLAATNDKGTVMALKWSFINRQGVQVIAPTEIPFAGAFSEGLCPVRQNKKIGFMDTRGKVVIPCRYYSAHEGFKDGLAVVNYEKGGKYSYIDHAGKTVIPFKYTSAHPFYNGQALVSQNGKYQLIDKKGNALVKFEADPAQTFFAKQQVVNNRIRAAKDGKYGYMDGNGRVVIPIQYIDAQSFFGDGLVGVTLTGVKKKNKSRKVGGWFFIDENGERNIVREFEEVGRFSEGRCWVKQNGLWGSIDTMGRWKIRPRFKSMPTMFHNGVSRITQEVDTGKFLPEKFYAYISNTGQVVWKP